MPLRTTAAWRVLDGFGGSVRSLSRSVDGRAMRRILSFDPHSGVIEAEGGVSIAEIWRHTLPHGWWPAVVPGTMFPTMGGCVAMNIHGKNCFKVGPFGDHVLELDLVTASGEKMTLSRERDR